MSMGKMTKIRYRCADSGLIRLFQSALDFRGGHGAGGGEL